MKNLINPFTAILFGTSIALQLAGQLSGAVMAMLLLCALVEMISLSVKSDVEASKRFAQLWSLLMEIKSDITVLRNNVAANNQDQSGALATIQQTLITIIQKAGLNK